MPTCTAEAILAFGAAFQELSDVELRIARVGLLWAYNGSTGTQNTLLATGAAFQGCSEEQIRMFIVAVLNKTYLSQTASALLASSKAYLDASPEQLNLCQTTSAWVSQGGLATPSLILASSVQFQKLSPFQLAIVELVLVCSIFSVALTIANLNNLCTTFKLQELEPGLMQVVAAYLYCNVP